MCNITTILSLYEVMTNTVYNFLVSYTGRRCTCLINDRDYKSLIACIATGQVNTLTKFKSTTSKYSHRVPQRVVTIAHPTFSLAPPPFNLKQKTILQY